MLSADADRGCLIARNNDVVDEAWQRRDATDQERGESAPVGGKFGGVAVHAMEPIHVRHGNVGMSNEEVAEK